jgi:hypothetical protein
MGQAFLDANALSKATAELFDGLGRRLHLNACRICVAQNRKGNANLTVGS